MLDGYRDRAPGSTTRAGFRPLLFMCFCCVALFVLCACICLFQLFAGFRPLLRPQFVLECCVVGVAQDEMESQCRKALNKAYPPIMGTHWNLAPRGGPCQRKLDWFPDVCGTCQRRMHQQVFTLLDVRVSSLRRGHANLLCIVPILTDDPRRQSNCCCSCSCCLFCLWGGAGLEEELGGPQGAGARA